MKIYIDCHEHPKKINDILYTFDILGVPYERKRLETGDYVMAEDAGSTELHTVIDRKGGGLDELSNNLGIDRERFHKELKRAVDSNIHLVILIADERRTCLEDVADWEPYFKAPNRTMTGEMLLSLMKNAIRKYKGMVAFQFCRPEEMGTEIIRILSE